MSSETLSKSEMGRREEVFISDVMCDRFVVIIIDISCTADARRTHSETVTSHTRHLPQLWWRTATSCHSTTYVGPCRIFHLSLSLSLSLSLCVCVCLPVGLSLAIIVNFIYSLFALYETPRVPKKWRQIQIVIIRPIAALIINWLA